MVIPVFYYLFRTIELALMMRAVNITPPTISTVQFICTKRTFSLQLSFKSGTSGGDDDDDDVSSRSSSSKSENNRLVLSQRFLSFQLK